MNWYHWVLLAVTVYYVRRMVREILHTFGEKP